MCLAFTKVTTMQIMNDETGTHITLAVCGTPYTLYVSPANLAEIKRIYYSGMDVTKYIKDVMRDEFVAIEDELVMQLAKLNQFQLAL